MRTFSKHVAAAALSTLMMLGCSSDDDTPMSTGGSTETGGDDSPETGGSATTGGAMGTDTCGLPQFALDVVAEGESLKVRLLNADPAPPERYDNDWEVEVTDLEGNPVTDPAEFEVIPYMVDHGHGVKPGYEPVVTPLNEPGQYLISPVHMHMAGKWDIWFKAPGELNADAATLYACIPD